MPEQPSYGTRWAVAMERVDRNVVFGRCVRAGLVVGLVAGAASGTVAFPVLGTFVGALVGFGLAVPVSLAAATAIANSVHATGTVQGFRRRIDVTFAVLAAATAALAVGWIS
ncbi:MAG: hypothetical protein ACXW2C_12015, partial [Acidimicrobiia bacterium]